MPTNDAAAVQSAIDGSKPGDTISFAAGRFNLAATLTLPGSRSYTGDSGADLHFSVPGGSYGIALAPGASNVSVSGLKLVGGGIRLSDGTGYSHVSISHNDISQTAGTPGIYASVASESLKVDGNYLHDFSNWGAILWNMDRGSYSQNVLARITQGAQIMNPGSDVTASKNVGRGLHRMGLEIQESSQNTEAANGLNVSDNVFFDWNTPYYDSFGLSVMPQRGQDVTIKGNFLDATSVNGYGEADAGGTKRFGYGIEAGLDTGVVSGNTIVGPFWAGVVASQADTLATGNALYGSTIALGGETGGSLIDLGNSVGNPLSAAPGLPTWALDRLDSPLGQAVTWFEPSRFVAVPEPVGCVGLIVGGMLSWTRRKRR